VLRERVSLLLTLSVVTLVFLSADALSAQPARSLTIVDGGCEFSGQCPETPEPPPESLPTEVSEGDDAAPGRASAGGTAEVLDGRALMRIRCDTLEGERCAGSLELWRHLRRSGAPPRRLLLGYDDYDLGDDGTVIVEISLSRLGRRLLAASDGKLKVALRGDVVSRIVTLSSVRRSS